MNITPDSIVFTQLGPFAINATLVFTWVVMALLGLGSWLVTRRLSVGPPIPKWQNLLEIVVKGISDQIEEISRQDARPYLPFIGTLFLFIAVSNLLSIVPGYHAPTGSLSTTSALAICVFVAVPLYSLARPPANSIRRSVAGSKPATSPTTPTGEAVLQTARAAIKELTTNQ